MQKQREFMEKVILEAGALIRQRIGEDMSIEDFAAFEAAAILLG